MDNRSKDKTGLKKVKMGFLTVFFMVFCAVSSGAYGIEEMIPLVGPGLTLILLMVLPILYGMPLGLVSAELGSAIPEEGGFYKWIQRGMGEYWGFLACWWRTGCMYSDTTLYVILSVSYIDTFCNLTPLTSAIVKFVIVFIVTYINLRGAKDVGALSSFFSVFIIITFLIITVLGFIHWDHSANPFIPITPPNVSIWASLGFGVSMGVWLYSGVNSISTITGELEDPQILPKVIIRALPILALLYFLPTLAGLGSIGQWESWGTEVNFVNMSQLANSPIFTAIFVITAILACLSLFNIGLATGSRGFFVLSDDNLCPKIFTHINKKHGTPDFAIITMAIVSLILAQFGFDKILIVVVLFGGLSFFMVFLAAFLLRVKEPELERPYKVPLGTKGLIISSIPAMLIILIAILTNSSDALFFGLLGVLTGPVAYFFFKRKYLGLDKDDPDHKINPKTGVAYGDITRITITIGIFAVYSICTHVFLKLTGDTTIYCTLLMYAAIILAVVTIILFIIAKKIDHYGERTRV